MNDKGKDAPPNPALLQNLRVAVRSHRLVHLASGDGRGSKLFAPHAIYRDMSGKLCVVGYELPTPRSIMTEEGSRTVPIAQINELSLTSYRFNPHPTFNSRSRKFEGGVMCAVDRV